MHCDYYIEKGLRVWFVDEEDDMEHMKWIPLERERGYFYSKSSSYSNDEDESSSSSSSSESSTDDDSYTEEDSKSQKEYLSKIYSHCLDVKYTPRTIFQNNKWRNEDTKKKYKKLIKEEIGKESIILKVIKEEKRYLR